MNMLHIITKIELQDVLQPLMQNLLNVFLLQ